MAAGYGREIGVFTNVAVICRPTWKEAEEYFQYYAVENMVEGRRLNKPGQSAEEKAQIRRRAAGGNGAFPIIGCPDEVATTIQRLSDGGVTALAVGLVNYLEHFPYVRDEVLPRLERLGLREG